jgi:uncharacterized protein YbdZ (MbtH family)
MVNPDPATGTDERESVVINGKGQHSIQPGERPRPAGWSEGRSTGLRETRVDLIERMRNDMRPVSAR